MYVGKAPSRRLSSLEALVDADHARVGACDQLTRGRQQAPAPAHYRRRWYRHSHTMLNPPLPSLTIKGIRVQGEAEIMWNGKEYRYAHDLLKEKYPEYQSADGSWKEGDVPIIKITPTSFTKWASGHWTK